MGSWVQMQGDEWRLVGGGYVDLLLRGRQRFLRPIVREVYPVQNTLAGCHQIPVIEKQT